MSAEIIQVEYESLKAIAVCFDRASEQSGALRGRLDSCAHRLRESWRGAAAIAFFGEMDHALLPALNRLGGALSDAAATTREIGETMRAAEEEAAALFKVESIEGVAKQPDPAASVDLDDPPFDDMPATFSPNGAAHTPIAGTVVVDGVHPDDIDQGELGDCYLLSSLAAIAAQDPDVITRMIRDNGNGTYTVTFYEVGGRELRPVQITVDKEFLTRNGIPIFAELPATSDGSNELWPLIVEKAYAEWKGSYGEIYGGYPDVTMMELTGEHSTRWGTDALSLTELATMHTQGHAIVVDTHMDWEFTVFGWQIDLPDATNDPVYDNHGLVPSHSYFVESVDPVAGTVTIRNPWGPQYQPITLTEDEYRKAFSDVNTNPIRTRP